MAHVGHISRSGRVREEGRPPAPLLPPHVNVFPPPYVWTAHCEAAAARPRRAAGSSVDGP